MVKDKFHLSIKCSTLSDDALQQVLKQCFGVGFTTTKDGQTDIVDEYESSRYSNKQAAGGYNCQKVVSEITEDGVGAITFWYGKYPVTMDCFLKTDAAPSVPNFIFEVDRYVFETDENSLTPQDYVNTFLNLIERLVTVLDVVFAKAECGIEINLPSERPIADHLEYLPWLTVFSERNVEELGGYERVIAAPVWKVEKLDSGHVLLVKSNNPFSSTESPAVSPEEYLLKRNNSNKF